MSKRPSARLRRMSTMQVDAEAFELLVVKAEVCDAYVTWLGDPSKTRRARLSAALERLALFERRLHAN